MYEDLESGESAAEREAGGKSTEYTLRKKWGMETILFLGKCHKMTGRVGPGYTCPRFNESSEQCPLS